MNSPTNFVRGGDQLSINCGNKEIKISVKPVRLKSYCGAMTRQRKNKILHIYAIFDRRCQRRVRLSSHVQEWLVSKNKLEVRPVTVN
jgi:hypothetical protein